MNVLIALVLVSLMTSTVFVCSLLCDGEQLSTSNMCNFASSLSAPLLLWYIVAIPRPLTRAMRQLLNCTCVSSCSCRSFLLGCSHSFCILYRVRPLVTVRPRPRSEWGCPRRGSWFLSIIFQQLVCLPDVNMESRGPQFEDLSLPCSICAAFCLRTTRWFPDPQVKNVHALVLFLKVMTCFSVPSPWSHVFLRIHFSPRRDSGVSSIIKCSNLFVVVTLNSTAVCDNFLSGPSPLSDLSKTYIGSSASSSSLFSGSSVLDVCCVCWLLLLDFAFCGRSWIFLVYTLRLLYRTAKSLTLHLAVQHVEVSFFFDFEVCWDPSDCVHQSQHCLLLLLLLFKLPFPCKHAPIFLSVLALPFLRPTIPDPDFAFPFPFAPAFSTALACVPSFACTCTYLTFFQSRHLSNCCLVESPL